MTPLNRRQIAWRAAQDIIDGSYVNLGIGLPTLVADFIPTDREIVFHSENGVLGLGKAPPPELADPDLINAGKQPVTLLPGGSFFHHNDAFVMIRGGHIDVSLLGAFEVSRDGDLANWATNDPTFPPGVGGAMDLAAGAKEVRVLVEHTTKTGEPRIRNRCTYPLTAPHCVRRIYTNLAVIDVTTDGLVVREMIEGMNLDRLQAVTEPPLRLANDWQKLAPPAV
ncbi:MAG TPA: 3-oxoacid CoA-transferase subunit B [Stellaceae bacterium]|nr:3-oxoacid CoA-transferase subunit B [Stellaceae bacterium]